MTRWDKKKESELFGGAVKTRIMMCRDGAVGGMMQQGEEYDENETMMSGGSVKVDSSDMVQGDDAVMMCRDDAVGGMLQQNDEYNDNGIMMCEDGATYDMMQHIGDDDVFVDSEKVMKGIVKG